MRASARLRSSAAPPTLMHPGARAATSRDRSPGRRVLPQRTPKAPPRPARARSVRASRTGRPITPASCAWWCATRCRPDLNPPQEIALAAPSGYPLPDKTRDFPGTPVEHNLTPGNIGPARGAVGHTAAFLGACALGEPAGRAGARAAVASREPWPRSMDTRRAARSGHRLADEPAGRPRAAAPRRRALPREATALLLDVSGDAHPVRKLRGRRGHFRLHRQREGGDAQRRYHG